MVLTLTDYHSAYSNVATEPHFGGEQMDFGYTSQCGIFLMMMHFPIDYSESSTTWQEIGSFVSALIGLSL